MDGKVANPELIRKLTEIQARNKLTDGEMAQTLGCSRQLYNATKMGKISIGLTILRGIKQSFPELSSSILISLDNATAGKRTNRPQARRSRFLGGLWVRLVSFYLKTFRRRD